MARAREHLPVIALLVGVGAQAVLLLSRVGRGWFGVDALHYLAQRGGVGTPTETLMEPYAGHWQPLLILGYRTLYEFVGLDTYLPYVLPAVAVHVSLCLVLYAVTVGLGANRWAAVLAAVVLAWFGAGSEAFLADAPVALTSTVLCAYVCVAVVHRRSWDRRSLVVVVALLVAALMVSNAALTAVVFVGFVVLARRGWKPALVVVGLPAVAFLGWYAALGRKADRGDVSGDEVLALPERAASLLVAPFDSAVPGGLGATVLLAVLLVPMVARRVSPQLRSVALAGMLAALLQAVLCAAANVALGEQAVLVGRYQYVVLAYLLPAVVATLTVVLDAARSAAADLGRARLVPVLVTGGLLAAVVVNGLQAQQATWRLTQFEADKAEALTKGGVLAVGVGQRMLDEDAGGFTVHGDDIVTFGEAGAAEWESMKATPEQRLTSEALLFTSAGPETFVLPAPARMSSSSFDRRLRERFGCQVLEATDGAPEMVLDSFVGAQVAVESDSSEVIVELSRDGDSAEPVRLPLTPGETSYIATSAQLAEMHLTFNAGGRYEVCRS
jgi:hypothetical protein